MKVDEGPAFGAALLAGVGGGIYGSVKDACEKAVGITDRVEPVEENQKIYDKYYEVYKSLYPALKGCFDRTEKISGQFL